jgi:beta-glucosidase
VPRAWFGEGLAYTTFAWGEPSAGGDALTVTVPVTNTGPRAGDEVVQVYLRRPASAVMRPAWVLGGFTKVRLHPGETIPVRVVIDPDALRHWDGGWAIEPGPLELRVARSAGDPGQVVTTTLPPR